MTSPALETRVWLVKVAQVMVIRWHQVSQAWDIATVKDLNKKDSVKCLDHFIGDVNSWVYGHGVLQNQVIIFAFSDVFNGSIGAFDDDGKLFIAAPIKILLDFSLLALHICLSAGMGLQQVRRHLPKLSQRAEELIGFSAQTGAALSSLLLSEIAMSNQRATSESLTQAKKLSVALLIPLAATTLPAFLLLTIVPMIIGITQ